MPMTSTVYMQLGLQISRPLPLKLQPNSVRSETHIMIVLDFSGIPVLFLLFGITLRLPRSMVV